MHQAKAILLVALVAFVAVGLAACAATPQGMAVNTPAVANPLPKYRSAISVRSVTGGQAMNILTGPGVANEPFKAALESSLAAVGYLASSGAPKFYLDVDIQNLQQPLIGMDMDVTATVSYKLSNAAGGEATSYPIVAKGSAALGDAVIAAERLRVANARAMQENIKAFIQALR